VFLPPNALAGAHFVGNSCSVGTKISMIYIFKRKYDVFDIFKILTFITII